MKYDGLEIGSLFCSTFLKDEKKPLSRPLSYYPQFGIDCRVGTARRIIAFGRDLSQVDAHRLRLRPTPRPLWSF